MDYFYGGLGFRYAGTGFHYGDDEETEDKIDAVLDRLQERYGEEF